MPQDHVWHSHAADWVYPSPTQPKDLRSLWSARCPRHPKAAGAPVPRFQRGAQHREQGLPRDEIPVPCLRVTRGRSPYPEPAPAAVAGAAPSATGSPEPLKTRPGAGPAQRLQTWEELSVGGAEATGGCAGKRFLIDGCGTVSGGGSMVRELLSLFLVVALIIEALCKNETEAIMRIAYNKLIRRKIIAKRQINCNWDEYSLGAQCCKKCEPGFVKNISCPTDTSKHCVSCENGKEYIDHVNDLAKCLRCASCDSVFGLEVAKNCTQAQNTKCACAKNHFCNSSVPCRHCDPCTICESGVIEKQCTSTSDTVCGMKETGMPWWAILLTILTILVPLAFGGIAYYGKRKWANRRERLCEFPQPRISDKITEITCHEMCLSSHKRSMFYKACFYSLLSWFFFQEIAPLRQGVDLSSYVADIVEQMTYEGMLKFVRYHRVPETKIDEIIRDNIDTSERKIQFFQAWLQRHGMNGAYETLIRSLRKLQMCAVADKIERILQEAVSNSE
ncbi:tumor necrosis factor receptor superfamily member 6 [Guaruba guarouba]